jgi:hypothetical protein
MIALFGCRRLDQNSNCRANANSNKSWPKSLIVSDYGRIWYYNWILLKIGHAPITNWISNTYCTVSGGGIRATMLAAVAAWLLQRQLGGGSGGRNLAVAAAQWWRRWQRSNGGGGGSLAAVTAAAAWRWQR